MYRQRSVWSGLRPDVGSERSGVCSAASRLERRDRLAPWVLVLLVAAGFLFPPPAHPIEVPLIGPIPADIGSIELSYSGEQELPSVTFIPPSDVVSSPSYRLPLPSADLVASLHATQVFGSCKGEFVRKDGEPTARVSFAGAAGERCGVRIELRPDSGILDIMSYSTIRLRGRAVGQVVVALEDRAKSMREDNVPLAKVSGTFDLTIPLRELGRSLDLRKVTALVVTTEEPQASVILDQLVLLQHHSGSAYPTTTGIWAWRFREALEDPDAIFAICQRYRYSRVALQMPAWSESEQIWAAYARLLVQMQAKGIDAVALDGYPEAVQEPQKIAQKIQRLLDLMAPAVLAGVQLDIEPYLRPGFLEDESGPRLYLEAIDIIGQTIGRRTRLSVVMPFWLATPTVGGRPLAFAVMDRADEVVVMSYRTNLDEVKAISEDILRYGDLIGLPVWLALETVKLPVERYVTLKRELQVHLADAVLDRAQHRLMFAPFSPPLLEGDQREGFRIHHRSTVRPERVTFAGRHRSDVEKAAKTLLGTIGHRSLSGVMIHDFDGFRALTE